MARGPTGLTTSLVGATTISDGAILSPCRQAGRLARLCRLGTSWCLYPDHLQEHFAFVMLLLWEASDGRPFCS